jgi:GH25 family lysozyme M1 (1,4-beta-N-acetylmuramidase)
MRVRCRVLGGSGASVCGRVVRSAVGRLSRWAIGVAARWVHGGAAAWVLGVVAASACGGSQDEATGSASLPLEECPVAGVEAIDVSDDQGSIDWNAVADAGVGFAMIKATQGTYDTQGTFARNWARARAAGIVRGAYHFFDPTEDGVLQAEHFLAVVGPLAASDLPPMLDIECPDGDADCLYAGAAGDAPAVEIATRTWAFLRAVARATGRTPIVYTFGSYFEANGIDTTGLDAFPLFLAFPTTGACLDVPSPWSAATLWQYSWAGDVDGIEGAVDRDRLLVPVSALTGNVQSTPMAATSAPTATVTSTPTPDATVTSTSTPTATSTSTPTATSTSTSPSSSGESASDPPAARSSSCSLAPPRSRPGSLVPIASLFALVLGSRRRRVREPRLLRSGHAC